MHLFLKTLFTFLCLIRRREVALEKKAPIE